jgi:hypothetical protein
MPRQLPLVSLYAAYRCLTNRELAHEGKLNGNYLCVPRFHPPPTLPPHAHAHAPVPPARLCSPPTCARRAPWLPPQQPLPYLAHCIWRRNPLLPHCSPEGLPACHVMSCLEPTTIPPTTTPTTTTRYAFIFSPKHCPRLLRACARGVVARAATTESWRCRPLRVPRRGTRSRCSFGLP